MLGLKVDAPQELFIDKRKEMEYSKMWVKPMDALEAIRYEMPKHITYNKDLKIETSRIGDYRITVGSTDDGSGLFLGMLISDMFTGLITKTSLDRRMGWCKIGFNNIWYEVSDIRYASVFGRYPINGMIIDGRRSRMSIQVRMHFDN